MWSGPSVLVLRVAAILSSMEVCLNEERIARINGGVLSMLQIGSLDEIKSTELERIIFSKKC